VHSGNYSRVWDRNLAAAKGATSMHIMCCCDLIVTYYLLSVSVLIAMCCQGAAGNADCQDT
jgi:hypothetical protein